MSINSNSYRLKSTSSFLPSSLLSCEYDWIYPENGRLWTFTFFTFTFCFHFHSSYLHCCHVSMIECILRMGDCERENLEKKQSDQSSVLGSPRKLIRLIDSPHHMYYLSDFHNSCNFTQITFCHMHHTTCSAGVKNPEFMLKMSISFAVLWITLCNFPNCGSCNVEEKKSPL